MGLAAGDAVSWTSMYKRSYLLPVWTRRIRREMDAASEGNNLTSVPVPFSLNRPSEPFNFLPADNTEWSYFTAEILLSHGRENFKEELLNAWVKLAESQQDIRGSVSIRGALNNIARGIMPPKSGMENPHYFDDSALIRSVPVGLILAGEPEAAAELAETDACVTNYEDGVWAAKFAAAFVSLLSVGSDFKFAYKNALEYLPDGSWIRRTVESTMSLADGNESVFSILPRLQKEIVNKEYSYGISSPETLALALAITAKHGDDFETALLTANALPRNAERLPALTAAFAGALSDKKVMSDEWTRSVRFLQGVCIPGLKDTDFEKFVFMLADNPRKVNL